MNYRVRFSASARRDFGRLADWLEIQSPAAATRARELVLEAIASLKALPHRGRPVTAGLREIVAPFGHGGYVIRYGVRGRTVSVTRIKHNRESR